MIVGTAQGCETPMQLHCGDCLEVLSTIPDNTVQAFFCDLPYGQIECRWDCEIDLDKFWKQAKRVGKADCAFAFTATFKFALKLVQSNPAMFRYECIIQKPNVSNPMLSTYRHMPQHELLLVFFDKRPPWRRDAHHTRPVTTYRRKREVPGSCFGKPENTQSESKYEPRLPTTLLKSNYVCTRHTVHPTRKCPDMITDLLKYWCKAGDTVVDPTMGSGSTGEACHRLGLHFIGIEKDQQTFSGAQKRLSG